MPARTALVAAELYPFGLVVTHAGLVIIDMHRDERLVGPVAGPPRVGRGRRAAAAAVAARFTAV
jgi:hypothetical protein